MTEPIPFPYEDPNPAVPVLGDLIVYYWASEQASAKVTGE